MTSTIQQRFATLDVFRGMTMFLMIIVNTQGSGATPFRQLMHAEWNGFTLTDLVFPSFLFAVGNAMPFAMRKWDGLPTTVVIYKILKRSVLIFIVGYLLSWYVTMHWSNGRLEFWRLFDTRIMAVLQRIALCYFFAAFMVWLLPIRTTVIISVAILLLYWFMLAAYGSMSMQDNLVRQIDLSVIGASRMYREQGVIFDPEGLLSTLPAIVSVIAGYLVGWFIQKRGKTNYTCLMLLFAGCILVVAGLFWSYIFPFNKKLWTSSYVLLTAGIDALVIGILLYLVDIKNGKTVTWFFAPMGRNPLFIYVLSNLLLFFLILPVDGGKLFFEWVNEVFFQQVTPGPFGAFFFSLVFTMICWSIAWLLDKKRLYVRL
jgi:predicted acyltransferase